MEMMRDNEVEMKHKSTNSSNLKYCDMALRATILGLTLVGTILVGTDKQTKIVSISLVPTLPPLRVPATAKWHYLSAFVYFVVANSIACTHVVLSLVLTLASIGKSKGFALIITLLDQVVLALLFSANGAALAVGLIGYEGNSHVRWNKVCNVFGRFCDHVAAAVAMSMLASLGLLVLVALHSYNLHKKIA